MKDIRVAVNTCQACGRLDPWNRGSSCYCLQTGEFTQPKAHDDREVA